MRRNYPALLDEERALLDRQAARPALPAMLLEALDLTAGELATASREDLRALVREKPCLAAWYALLAANAKVGGVHLMLTEKYLFKPQRSRDESGAGDSPLVSNRRGTSGMEEPLLVRLARARRDHALRMFGMVAGRDMGTLAGGAADGGVGGGGTGAHGGGAGASAGAGDAGRLPTVRYTAGAGG
jgi:hypothetical protein